MLRAACSADVHRCRPDSINIKDTRVFAGSRRTTYRDQKNVCLVKNCHPRVTLMLQARYEKQRSTKTKENTVNVKILERRNTRLVPNKRRVEVQSQNRELLIRDVCTCLAHRGVSPSIPEGTGPLANSKASMAKYSMLSSGTPHP